MLIVIAKMYVVLYNACYISDDIQSASHKITHLIVLIALEMSTTGSRFYRWEDLQPREVTQECAQGHRASRRQGWDFNQGSHALNDQAILLPTNPLKTSLTKTSPSCAKSPSLKVKQSASSRTHAGFGSDESDAISWHALKEFRI